MGIDRIYNKDIQTRTNPKEKAENIGLGSNTTPSTGKTHRL
jgi:hypothetical protein